MGTANVRKFPILFHRATAQKHKAADTEDWADLLLSAVMLIQATLKSMLSYILSMIYTYKYRGNYQNNLPR